MTSVTSSHNISQILLRY